MAEITEYIYDPLSVSLCTSLFTKSLNVTQRNFATCSVVLQLDMKKLGASSPEHEAQNYLFLII